MNRNDFSSGKKIWHISCAKCSNYKGQCLCSDANVVIINRNANALAERLLNDERPIVREFIGLATGNPYGITRSTFRIENAIGIGQGVVHDNDARQGEEDT